MSTRKPNQESDDDPGRTMRLVVGILMTLQTGAMACIAFVFAIFIIFMGGLAFVGGAGGATDEQIKSTWLYIFLMAGAPFLWPILLAFASFNIFLRKRPLLVIILCALSVLFEVAVIVWFYQIDSERHEPSVEYAFLSYQIFAAVLALIPVGGIWAALQMRRKKKVNQAS